MNLNKENIEKCSNPSELGEMLRQAAKEGQVNLVQLIIDKGLEDVDYNSRGINSEDEPTPLQWAVIKGNLDIAKLLLENGADVSITDECGYRPFNEAIEGTNDRWGYRALGESIESHDKEIIELIKSYEPEEWHQRQWCIERLKKLELPDEVIEFLGSENRRIDLKESDWTTYVKFYALDEIRTFKWKDMTFVDLVYEVEGYENIGVISWIPEHKSFACLDIEHEKFGFIPGLTWKEFMNNPVKYVDGSLSWEFCEGEDEDE